MSQASLLEGPEAQALPGDAEASAARGCRDRLTALRRRYRPRFYHPGQRASAGVVVRGRLSNLQRNTSEPIASRAGRAPVQHFAGAGAWDDEAVVRQRRGHAAEARGGPHGVPALDPSGSPKKGTAPRGVAGPRCGRRGQAENGPVGAFLTYVTASGGARLRPAKPGLRAGPRCLFGHRFLARG